MSWVIDTCELKPKNYSLIFVKFNYFEVLRFLYKVLLFQIGVPGKQYLSLLNQII